MKKICVECGKEKPIDEFYKQKSYCLSKCKACVRAQVRRYREQNIEKIRAYDRKRGSLKHRVEARKKYAKTEKVLRH